MGADIQYYSNAGNTVDESPIVRDIGFYLSFHFVFAFGVTFQKKTIKFPPFADHFKDAACDGQCLPYPQPAGPFCCLQDQPALQHGL